MSSAKKDYLKAIDGLISQVADWSWDDPISSIYVNIFTAAKIVKHTLNDEELKNDLKWRITHNIPPGYKDKAKDDGGIGDVLIWHSLIELAKTQGKNVVFVTDEQKADWVVKNSSALPFAVRPELAHEFHQKTNHYFGLISFPDFLKRNGAPEETVHQAKSVQRSLDIDFASLSPSSLPDGFFDVLIETKSAIAWIATLISQGNTKIEPEFEKFCRPKLNALASIIRTLVNAVGLRSILGEELSQLNTKIIRVKHNIVRDGFDSERTHHSLITLSKSCDDWLNRRRF